MIKKIFALFVSCAALTACHHVPLNATASNSPTFKDITLSAPSIHFSETPQSKSVIVGSAVYASVNSCQLIKRYRVRTNADFTASLNLMKYRAALMGAKWITIVQHSELDKFENAYQLENDKLILQDGTEIGSSRYLTSIVADLYDCPCNTTTCSGR